MSASITSAREFAVRKLAMHRAIAAGARAQAQQAQRLAASLFAQGRSVDTAARLAVQSVTRCGGAA